MAFETILKKRSASLARVLIADDDENIRIVVRRALESTGQYDVFEASDGKQAFKMARRKKPDLIILDLTMPGMDGLDVLAALREKKRTQHTPVIVLTGRDDRESLSRAMHDYAEAYISKPVSISELRDKVEKVMKVHPNRKL